MKKVYEAANSSGYSRKNINLKSEFSGPVTENLVVLYINQNFCDRPRNIRDNSSYVMRK